MSKADDQADVPTKRGTGLRACSNCKLLIPKRDTNECSNCGAPASQFTTTYAGTVSVLHKEGSWVAKWLGHMDAHDRHGVYALKVQQKKSEDVDEYESEDDDFVDNS